MVRQSFILAVLALLAIPAVSKDKKSIVPELILRARYVDVVVDPDSGMSVLDPGENRIAQTDVENALLKWGRFKTTIETTNADLVLVIRKGGKPMKQTIAVPRNPPVVVNPSSPSDINVGVRVGTPPPLRTDSQIDSPAPRTEVGPSEDILEVYRGGPGETLDGAPLWRYAARNGLQHPSVPAIDKFRKAIEEAEKNKKP